MSTLIEISEKLGEDMYSGSSQVVAKFLEALSEKKISREEMERAFNILISAHPDMAVLQHAFKILRNVPIDGIHTAAKEFLRSLKNSPRRIGEYLAEMLPQKAIVLSYSQSGTVGEALLRVHEMGKLGGVILSESRPGLEGRKFASFFLENNIQVTLSLDCALGSLIEGADAVAIGSDAVTVEYIVNKIGSLQLALLANYFDKPIFALASTHKFVSSAIPQKIAEPKNIWDDAPIGIFVQSPLYERVPLALLTAVICERGLVGIEEIEMILE
ncbi:hypothetical protein DRQ33_06220 [bacterium]|nr:MAG: hypothetical protein DRQ33_06220 [bacterium]